MIVVCAAEAGAECPPPSVFLRTIQNSSRVSLVRLGSRAQRSRNPFEVGPGRFLGFERLQTSPLGPVVMRAMVRTFGRPGSYACSGPPPKDSLVTQPVQIGIEFESDRGRIRVVLQQPEQLVQLEFMNGATAEAPLNERGVSSWREVLRSLVPPDGSPRDFYASIGAAEDSVVADSPEPEPAGLDTLELDLQPITKVNPVYPELARSAGVDGTVILRVLIGPNGVPRDARVVRSIEMLSQAALEAVRQWRFPLPKKNGVSVMAWTTVPVHFSLR